MDRPEQTLSAVLDAGELLLTSGAEAARVEDTMRRLARAYGFVRADVLTIMSSRHGRPRRQPPRRLDWPRDY